MSGPEPGALHVVVVLTDRPGAGPRERQRTLDSLLRQAVPDWSVVDGPPVQGPEGHAEVPRDVPVPQGAVDPLVLVLPVGTVVGPDLLADLHRAAGRMGSRLVTWDLDVRADDDTDDEDDGAPRTTPALRFGWSPETLLSADYTGGCFALTLADWREAAAAVPADVPLLPWTLLLHLPVDLEPTLHLAASHVVLPPGRAAVPAVDDATATAVLDAALARRGVPATAARRDGTTRLVWAPAQWPTVTVVIPTRHNVGMLEPLLRSLATTTGPRFEVVVVDNGGRLPGHEEFYARDWGLDLRVLWWFETPFHYGHVNNAAVEGSTADVVVLLNDDTLVEDPGWLAELVGLATMPGVGVAGQALLGTDGRLQHAGVWLGGGGYATHLLGGLEPGSDSVLGPTTWYRNTLAVTAACLAVRRETYLAVGGLDPRMTLCGSDVTLGLDTVALGLRTVCSPHATVRHFESVTRSSAPVGDQIVSLVRYQPWHDAGDPYGNARLSRRSTVPQLKPRRELDPVAQARDGLGVSL